MASQLQNSDCERLLNSLIKELGYPVNLGAGPALAYWPSNALNGPVHLRLADAAAAAELLVQPACWASHSGAGGRTLDFLLAMGEGEALHGAWMGAALEVARADPRDFRILTTMYEFTGNLARGEIRQRPRHGGRAGVLHSGNMLEFRWGGRHCLDVEDAIVDCGLERDGNQVRLFHESRFSAKVGLLVKRERALGSLRYEYLIVRDSPTIRLSVTFRPAPGARLAQLRLTTAIDDASADLACPVNALRVQTAGEEARRSFAKATNLATLHTGPARLLSLTHEGEAGPATSLLCRPGAPEALLNVKATLREPGRLHWIVNRYTPAAAADGGFAIGEDRLMVIGEEDGGFTAETLPAPEHARLRGRFDEARHGAAGEALNAVATHVLLARRGAYGPLAPSAERLDQLSAWYDRRLEAWFAAQARAPHGVRDTAFLLLSLDAMARATGQDRYRPRLEEALQALLACQAPQNQGAFALPGRAASLDGQAAALLALTRVSLSALPGDFNGMIREGLRQGLAALRPGSVETLHEGRRMPVDTPVVRTPLPEGGFVEDGALRTAKVALLRRALGEMALAQGRERLELSAMEMERLGNLSAMCLAMLRRRMRLGPEGVEVVAEAAGTLMTPESQAMATLALLDTPTVLVDATREETA